MHPSPHPHYPRHLPSYQRCVFSQRNSRLGKEERLSAAQTHHSYSLTQTSELLKVSTEVLTQIKGVCSDQLPGTACGQRSPCVFCLLLVLHVKRMAWKNSMLGNYLLPT